MFTNFKRAAAGFAGTFAAVLCLTAALAPALSTATPVAMFAAQTLGA